MPVISMILNPAIILISNIFHLLVLSYPKKLNLFKFSKIFIKQTKFQDIYKILYYLDTITKKDKDGLQRHDTLSKTSFPMRGNLPHNEPLKYKQWFETKVCN